MSGPQIVVASRLRDVEWFRSIRMSGVSGLHFGSQDLRVRVPGSCSR